MCNFLKDYSKFNSLKMSKVSLEKEAGFFVVRDFRDVMRDELGLSEKTDMDQYLNRMMAGDPDSLDCRRSVELAANGLSKVHGKEEMLRYKNMYFYYYPWPYLPGGDVMFKAGGQLRDADWTQGWLICCDWDDEEGRELFYAISDDENQEALEISEFYDLVFEPGLAKTHRPCK